MIHTEQSLLRMTDLQPRVPAWAKNEGMEASVPQCELWRFGRGIIRRIKEKKEKAAHHAMRIVSPARAEEKE